MQIKVFTTGGTIDKIYFDAKSSFEVGEPQIGQLLAEANVVFDYSVHPILQKDSIEITEAERHLIASTIAADPCERILVTHGTDTMIDTARVLQKIPDKTIVLVGSMQPARFRISDAVFNIGYAIGVAQLAPHGVFVAMNGRMFDPLSVRKNVADNRFEELDA